MRRGLTKANTATACFHFDGFRKEAEIAPLGRKFLLEKSAWRRIAEVARDKVLREHSYDRMGRLY